MVLVWRRDGFDKLSHRAAPLPRACAKSPPMGVRGRLRRPRRYFFVVFWRLRRQKTTKVGIGAQPQRLCTCPAPLPPRLNLQRDIQAAVVLGTRDLDGAELEHVFPYDELRVEQHEAASA